MLYAHHKKKSGQILKNTNNLMVYYFQAMSIMGLKDSAYWLSWLLWEIVLVLISSTLIVLFGMIFQFYLFLHNGFGVLFFMFFLFQFNMVILIFFSYKTSFFSVF